MDQHHFTCALLRASTGGKTLFLKRSDTKSRLPNLITGIGGKVEDDEMDDIIFAMLREGREENPQIDWANIPDLRRRLISRDLRTNGIYAIHWFTGTLHHPLTDFRSTEGKLFWKEDDTPPLSQQVMTPPAFACIPFVLGLPKIDRKLYEGTLENQNGVPTLLLAA